MPWEAIASVLPMLDFMQVDMKAGTSARHRALVGADNMQIVANLRKLAGGAVPFEVRIPVVPGCNDSPEELDAMIATLTSLAKVPPVELLAYHRLGESKFDRMGTAYSLAGTVPMSAESMEAIRQRFREKGIFVRA
jgi:pyruvate formate lyase activating enzyme